MARLKQNQNTDNLIVAVNVVLKNRCSLSDEEVKLFEGALEKLSICSNTKGTTNKVRLEIALLVVNYFLTKGDGSIQCI